MGCACGGNTAPPAPQSAAAAGGARFVLRTPDGKERPYLTRAEADAARAALGVGTVVPA